MPSDASARVVHFLAGFGMFVAAAVVAAAFVLIVCAIYSALKR